jgi:spermidine synthase
MSRARAPASPRSAGPRAGSRPAPLVLPYVLFFLSGAASLVYEIVWARQLTLVFGGSHLAVTTVLAVFMGGLALGAFLGAAPRAARSVRCGSTVGSNAGSRSADSPSCSSWPSTPPVRALARARGERRAALTILHVLFATVAMAAPTTLMGSTLPVLGRVVAERGAAGTGARLGWLYGINTLGAGGGAAMTGLVLLPGFRRAARSESPSRRTGDRRRGPRRRRGAAGVACAQREVRRSARAAADRPSADAPPPDRAIAGWFAARARGHRGERLLRSRYEVLWTRTLTMVVGTSTYAFTLILVAFLGGIGAGGAAYGLLERALRLGGGDGGESAAASSASRTRATLAFGVVQILIGAAALAVTYTLRDLPTRAVSGSRCWFASCPTSSERGSRRASSRRLRRCSSPRFSWGSPFPWPP